MPSNTTNALISCRARSAVIAAPVRHSSSAAARSPAMRGDPYRENFVALAAVVELDGRVLLARNAAWEHKAFALITGFMEAGETPQEGIAREVKEEAGLTVIATAYHSSQPWPFPSQLMIGLIAEVSDDQAQPDQTELEAVAWLTRAEARAVLAG